MHKPEREELRGRTKQPRREQPRGLLQMQVVVARPHQKPSTHTTVRSKGQFETDLQRIRTTGVNGIVGTGPGTTGPVVGATAPNAPPNGGNGAAAQSEKQKVI